jgi:hypothetical protein
MEQLLSSLPMRFLAEIAVVCFIVLLVMAATLWRSMRTKQGKEAIASRPLPSRLSGTHPRQDLAAGMVSVPQAVHGAARRQGIQPEESSQGSEEPRRLDRAYFKQEMGDLRDPEPGRAPAGGVRRPTGSLSRPESR